MGFLSKIKEFLHKIKIDNKIKKVQEKNFKFDENVLYKFLEKKSIDFFPEDGTWYSNCFEKSKVVHRVYLPCHLRDNEWMSKLMQKELFSKGIEISCKDIKLFMDNSKKFLELRHNYELEIVRWQIEWMKNGGGNWIAPREFRDDELEFSIDPDKMFRGGVVKTLSAIGMDRDVIEEGLEKYSDLWRDFYIEMSYVSRYNSYYLSKIDKLTDGNHKKNWIKMRNYVYYLKHKKSVDKYGTKNEGMEMSQEEAEKLVTILEKQNTKAKLYLEDNNSLKTEANNIDEYIDCTFKE